MTLTRDSILNGIVRERIREAAALGLSTPLTDAERQASLDAVLADLPAGADIWLFGYGSLMWNPAFHFAEKRTALLRGYHRRFCLWSASGRGSPDCPALTLGLDRGGACRGIAFRIAADQVPSELAVIWAREMISGSYRPRWVRLHSAEGPLHAVTFVIDRGQRRYVQGVPETVIAAHIAHAGGWLGTCAEYLENTVAHLDALGAGDSAMHRLLDLVRAQKAAPRPCGRWVDGTWVPDGAG